MKHLTALVLTSLLTSLLATGCASTPTIGDRMVSAGKAASENGRQWQQGEKLVKQGEKIRRRAQKQLADAKRDLQQAESKIAEGQRLMGDSEHAFAVSQQPTRR